MLGQPYDPKLGKWLHRIAAPTLVLWGEANRLIPVGQADVWGQARAGCDRPDVPGAGHLLFDESAYAVTAIGEFTAG